MLSGVTGRARGALLARGITPTQLALFSWPAVNAATFAFARVGEVVTIDRVWIPLLAIAVAWRDRDDALRPPGRPTRWILILGGLFALTYGIRAVLTTGEALGSLHTWFDAILLPLLLLAVARSLVVTRDDFRRLLAGLMVAGAVLAVIGILEFELDFQLATRSGGVPRVDHAIHRIRVSGPYSDPEIFALTLVVAYSATLGWIQLSSYRQRYWVGGLAVVLELTAIGITFFRAAWLAAAIITILCFAPRRRGVLRLAGAIALIAVLAGLLIIAAGGSHDLTTRLTNSQNVLGRVATAEQDLNVFSTRPVFGVGVGEFENHVTKETSAEVGGVAALPQPHNSYLGLLAEQGVVGVVPFVLLTFAVWWLIRASGKRFSDPADRIAVACVMASGIAYIVFSVTLTMLPYGPSNGFMTLMIGGLAGLLDGAPARAGEPPAGG